MGIQIYVCSEEIRRQLPEILQAHGIKVEPVDHSHEPLELNLFSLTCSRGLGRIELRGYSDINSGAYEFDMIVTHAVFWCYDSKLINRVEAILLKNGVACKTFESKDNKN